MKILQEFRTFVSRGNVVDLAVGVIIGSAFGKIVNSLVSDVLMPPLGFILRGVNMRDLSFVLQRDEAGAATVAIGYGSFLQHSIEFLIIAFAVFLLVKLINKFHRAEKAAAPATPSEEVQLLREIRDALKK